MLDYNPYKDLVSKKIFNQYVSNDAFCMVNDRDKNLKPIRIPLPECPRLDVINGFGLDASDQYFKPDKMPSRLKILQAKYGGSQDDIWDELNSSQTSFREEIEWIRKQWYHIKYGYWFFNFGQPTYITGDNYFYLNFWMVDGKLPEYRDRDRKWYLAYKFITDDAQLIGMISPKHRRAGDTSRAQQLSYMSSISGFERHSGIQSKTDKDGKMVFTKHFIARWRKLPFFLKPLSDAKNNNPKESIEWVSSTKAFDKKADKNRREHESLEASISYEPTNAIAYDGSKLYFYHGDEWGKIANHNVNEVWSVVKRCLTQANGLLVHGKALITTTVEEMEAKGGKAFYELCSQSMYQSKFENPNNSTKTGLVVVFIPADEGLDAFVGKHGESIINEPTPEQLKYISKKNKETDVDILRKGARKFLIDTREQYLREGDTEMYLDERRKAPLEYMDCFAISGKDSGFNLVKLDERRQEIQENNIGQYGRFEWLCDVKDSVVHFIPDPKGKFYVTKQLMNGDSNNKSLINGAWFPNNESKFKRIAGADPYKFNKTEGKKQSMGAGAVFELRNKEIDADNVDVKDWITHRFICTYLGRAENKTEYAEDMLKMCVYYGCFMNPEVNVPTVMDHFLDRGYVGYLLYHVDERTGEKRPNPGFNTTSEGMKNKLFRNVANYIEDHIHKEEHLKFIEECIDIRSLDDMTNYDLFTACAGALHGVNSYSFQRMIAINEFKYDEKEMSVFDLLPKRSY